MKPCAFSADRSCRRWLAIAALTCLGLYANDALLRFAAQQNPSTRLHYLLTCEPRSDTVVVLGSSMLANAISTQQLSEAIDGQAIQLATGGQGVQEQSLIWELYLSRHYCDTLVLELHDDSLRVGSLPAPLREDRYVAHLNREIVRRHLKTYSGPSAVWCWRYVPMWAFAEFSSKIGWQDWVGYLKGVPYDPHAPAIYRPAGEVSQRTLLRSRQLSVAAAQRPLHESATEALRSILLLAERDGVRVLLVEPPWFGGGVDRSGDASVGQTAARMRLQLPANRFRFSRSSVQDAALFDDARHASEIGCRRFTSELARHIRIE